MFDHKHYVPILRGRSSELSALAKLPSSTWVAITPLIEIPPIPSDWPELGVSVPAMSISQHISEVTPKLSAAIPKSKRFFVDGIHIEREKTLPDKREPIAAILDHLRDDSLLAVPVVGVNRALAYLTAAKETQAKDKRGFCLRLTASDLSSNVLKDRIADLFWLLGSKPEVVDLVLDYGVIGKDSTAGLIAATPARISRLLNIGEWRTLTLAATAMPENLSDIQSNTIKEVQRHEMELWLAIAQKRSHIKRIPSFGDYTTVNPNQREIDPRIITKAPSIKYTSGDSWIIAKGKARPKKKKSLDSQSDKTKVPIPPDSVQYPHLASQIMSSNAWRGEDFSLGDGRIAECVRKRANKKKATGSTGNWISAAILHHIAIVVEQLANLPDA